MGGQPWYPSECGVPDPSQLTCGVCGERMKHMLHVRSANFAEHSKFLQHILFQNFLPPPPFCPLLQVSLPPEEDTKDSSTHALMYLYICTKPDCGKEPRSWRALRCQWRPPTPMATRENPPPKSSGKSTNVTSETKPATILSTVGWGLSDGCKQAVSNPDASGFDFSDLEAALDAMNEKTTPAASRNANKSALAAEKEEGKLEDLAIELLKIEDEPVPLPGFYLDLVEGEVFENRLEKLINHSGGGDGRHKSDDSHLHINDLLQKYGENISGDIERLINYEDDEEKEEGDDKNGKQNRAGSSGGGSGKLKEAPADPVTWDGEGYEEDAVLAVEGRKGVDQTFLKFMKKLQRIPDQCVRQGRGGGMLWPSSSRNVPEPGVCSHCGAARVFEYQLMAPTIAALEESADWLKEEGGEDAAVERPPVSWDWVTVAVFGCRRRCFEGSKGVYREEIVVVCKEE